MNADTQVLFRAVEDAREAVSQHVNGLPATVVTVTAKMLDLAKHLNAQDKLLAAATTQAALVPELQKKCKELAAVVAAKDAEIATLNQRLAAVEGTDEFVEARRKQLEDQAAAVKKQQEAVAAELEKLPKKPAQQASKQAAE